MGTLIPFSSSKVPAYLAKLKAKGGGSLAAFSANVGGGFPVLHIKGKEFSVTRDGVRTQLQLPDADGELVPATYVDLVLLKANANLSKVYYAKGYEEGAANAKPDCFSNDGVRPDAAAATPQSKACASCPHNVFGTGAGGKGKACSDSRHVASLPWADLVWRQAAAAACMALTALLLRGQPWIAAGVSSLVYLAILVLLKTFSHPDIQRVLQVVPFFGRRAVKVDASLP